MPVQTQILTRRGTAASWTSTNPTLGAGEIGYETDTGRFKIGTGAAAWASLGYFNRDPLTTKGDLYTFSTTDDRLAVGANGETIVADSSTSTGLRYTAGNPIPNPVLNSAMQIWQRGTSMAAGTTTFCADRWGNFRGVSGSTFSRQTTSDTTNLPNIQYCVRAQRNSGDTNTTTIYLLQDFESVNSIPFAGKTITLSFYARAGANYSAASNALVTNLYTGTGTDQSLRSGYTGAATPISQTTTLTTTWQRFTYTGTIATTATQIGLRFDFTPVGTAGTNDYFEMTGVQIDIGSVALPFRTTTGTIQGELAACQRYYYRFISTTANIYVGNGIAFSTTVAYVGIQYPVTMRTRPTALEQSGTASDYATVRANSSVDNCTVVPVYAAQTTNQMGWVNLTSANLVSGNTTSIYTQSANAYLGWSAEL